MTLRNAICWALIAPGTARAADVPMHVETLAMGDTSGADPEDNAAIGAAPASLGLGERYDVQAGFAYGTEGGLHWDVSAVDARTNRFLAFGLGYAGDRTSPALRTEDLPGWQVTGSTLTNVRRTHDLLGAIAFHDPEHHIALGVGGDVSFFDHDQGGDGTTGNLDFGLAGRPISQLSLSTFARNVISSLDTTGDRPMLLGGGVRFEDTKYGALAAQVDIDPDDLSWRVGAGAEVVAGGARIRAGWQHGTTQVHTLTLGLGAETVSGAFGWATWLPLEGNFLDGMVQGVSLRIRAPSASDPPPFGD